MAKFTVLIFCAQALLIQNVFSACSGFSNLGNIGLGGYSGSGCGCGASVLSNAGFNNIGINNIGYNNAALNSGYGSYAGYGSSSGYGGSGTGEIAADGVLDVAGYSNVYGNLPVTGLVQFSGNLPAAGTVTVVGSTPSTCECGCNYY